MMDNPLSMEAPAAGPTSKRLDEERWLAAIVESSDDAIIGKTLDGIVTSWNAGAQRIFGYSADEVLGKPVTILIPQDLWHEEAEILEQLRNGERVDHFETMRVHKNGSNIAISLTISPIRDSSGWINGISKIARVLHIKYLKQMLQEYSDANIAIAKALAEDYRAAFGQARLIALPGSPADRMAQLILD
jgi:PAS domain S-box-containing protein